MFRKNIPFVIAITFFIVYELFGPMQAAFQAYLRLPTFVPGIILILAVSCRTDVLRFTSFSTILWMFAWIFIWVAFLSGYDENPQFFSSPMILNQWFRSAACVLAVTVLYQMHDMRLCRFVLMIALASIAGECLLTLVQIARDPEIARGMVLADQVAGEHFKGAVIFEGRQKGIASYAFIHSMPFLLPGLVALCKRKACKMAERLGSAILCALILLFLVRCQFATPAMLGFALFAISLGWTNNMARNFLYGVVVVVVAFIAKAFWVDLLKFVLGILSGIFVEGTLATKIQDSLTAVSSIGYTSQAEGRAMIYDMSWDAFFKSPLFGNEGHIELIGGHSYFVDVAAYFGLFWTLPFYIALVSVLKKLASYFSRPLRAYYLTSVIGFFALGFVKNMGGNEFYDVMFLILPCLLMYLSFLREPWWERSGYGIGRMRR